MSPFGIGKIGKIFRKPVSGTEGVASAAKAAERGPRLKPLGQSLDEFFPEIKHTSNPFALIASAEAGNPYAMSELSKRLTARVKLLESSAIHELDSNGSGSNLQELATKYEKLKAMALKLIIESAQRGNKEAQQKLLELVSPGR